MSLSKKILVPTDFTKVSDVALDHALLMGKTIKADIHMVHVVDSKKQVNEARLKLNSLQDRILMLSSIKYVDHVLPFASNHELESHINTIKPKYMVIGDDYRGQDIIGSQFIEEIIYVTRDNKSTSDVVERIYG